MRTENAMNQETGRAPIDLRRRDSTGQVHRCGQRAEAESISDIERMLLDESRARQARLKEIMCEVARELARVQVASTSLSTCAAIDHQV
jgi:hypothetical protein